MNISEFKKSYFSHYLLLEKDFKETTEFVALAKDNYNTFSVAYLKLLLTIGSEIDVMLEFLAKLYEPNTKEKGFGCSKIILKYEMDIKLLEVEVKNEEFSVFPWDCTSVPDWWTAYNEIKHNRYEDAVKFNPTRKYYQYANLQNVLTSLAALLSLELYAYRIIAKESGERLFVPAIKSIFSIKCSHWKDAEFGNGAVLIDGCLYVDTKM